jgi:hypothetical protein
MKEKKLALGFEPETFEVQFDIDTKVSYLNKTLSRAVAYFLDNWKFCFGHSKTLHSLSDLPIFENVEILFQKNSNTLTSSRIF